MPPARLRRLLTLPPRLALLATLLSAASGQAGPPEEAALPRPAKVGAYAAAVPGMPELPAVGPKGTLGPDVYRRRRQTLLEKFKSGAALVVNELSFEDDRQGMDFYYLTGIDEAGAALLLEPNAPPPPFHLTARERLFLATLDSEGERTHGARAELPSNALEVSTGIASLSRARALPAALVDACVHRGGLTYLGGFLAEPRPKPKTMDFYAKALERTYGCKVNDMNGTLARMREVKEPGELALMRKAIAYTAAGHAAALKAVHPGAREFEVKDAVEEAFRRAGARHLAYSSIVGSGTNSTFLHYPKDDRTMKAGELLLIDAAAEAEYYAADVTRTLPVSGTFSPEQRAVYEVVLRAQAAGIAAAKAGVRVADIDRATRQVIQDAGYYDYYIHGCCHFVGLEVHDAGDYDAPLPAGAVLTVEPGIYLPQRGFGVRIEDEILITASGAELLTGAIPREPAEIERLMAAGRR
jgi:Xaa-Pro aminopeptidase